jgi:hypothetical protein
MGLRRFVAILTIAVIIILAVVVWFFPSNEDFRVENPFWNGTEDITSLIPVSPIESLSELPSSVEGVTLILIPYLEFTPAELEAVDNFVRQGGTLVLADDYGYGNQVLEHLGLEARFSGQALLDPLFSYKNKRLPRIHHLASDSVTGDAGSLVLNHATGLVNVEDGDVLARSSSFSFLDINDNGVWDEEEPAGPLPVISQHSLSDGRIILIADPSILINSMETMESNPDLIEGIGVITPSRLYLDQSHLPPSELHYTKNLLACLQGFLVTPRGTVGIVILVLAITLIPVWYKKGGENDHGTEQ